MRFIFHMIIAVILGVLVSPLLAIIILVLLHLSSIGSDLTKLADKIDANERAALQARRDTYAKWSRVDNWDDWNDDF